MTRELKLTREQIKARLLRAASGKSQVQAAGNAGVHPSVINKIEHGRLDPLPEHMESLAAGGDLTVPDGEELLRVCESLRKSWRWRGTGTDALLDELKERLETHLAWSFRHLLTLSDEPPRPEDRIRAGEQLERLKRLPSAEARLAVVQVAEEYQNWALCELACEESVRQAARDLESAAAWARIAREIAERVRGTKGWRNRLLGYAMAHEANILRVAGELNEADVLLREAKHLWLAGSDPDRVLDPGRLLDLEAGLRREQRQFDEALRLLAQAESVSHFPYRARLLRALTFEAMGDYEKAIEVLLEAIPQVDLRAEPRERYIARFNLAVNQTHVGRHQEAAALVEVVRRLVTAEGDEINLARVKWLEGRIAAGLGRRQEAQALLEQARRDLEGWKIFFDAALALLEEMVLFLEEGRTAEVQALAPEVAKILDSKGVHREALVALRLFHEAVEREEATAELGRRVLRFLFRARYDQGLPFNAS